MTELIATAPPATLPRALPRLRLPGLRNGGAMLCHMITTYAKAAEMLHVQPFSQNPPRPPCPDACPDGRDPRW